MAPLKCGCAGADARGASECGLPGRLRPTTLRNKLTKHPQAVAGVADRFDPASPCFVCGYAGQARRFILRSLGGAGSRHSDARIRLGSTDAATMRRPAEWQSRSLQATHDCSPLSPSIQHSPPLARQKRQEPRLSQFRNCDRDAYAASRPCADGEAAVPPHVRNLGRNFIITVAVRTVDKVGRSRPGEPHSTALRARSPRQYRRSTFRIPC